MTKFENYIKQIIRVNHAGEYGAQKIYNGQIRFCKNSKLKKKLERISSEEKVHFDYFDEQMIKQRVRPTLMSPLWNILGTTLGVVSSRLGEDYVNACTESVEEVIVEHYKKQINLFNNQKINNEQSIIERFKLGFKYGFITLPADKVTPLITGLAISALIAIFVPPNFIAQYFAFNSYFMFILMLIVSLPIYVCATASIPIAVALLGKGVSAGAVFVFLKFSRLNHPIYLR